MRTAVLTLAILTVMATAAAAGDIFVSNVAGDDLCTGRNNQNTADMDGPVRTIAKALRMAHAGDRVVLINTGVPYSECVSLVGDRHSGDRQQSFVLLGNGAVLDGTAPVPDQGWRHYKEAVFRFQPRDLGPQQLFLEDKPAELVPCDGSGELPKLEPLQWTHQNGAIYFCVEQGKLPDAYHLRYARQQTGITLYHVDYVAITDLTVQGFRIDGINAVNSARMVQLTGVTSRGNGRCGVVVGGNSQVALDSCVVGDNRFAQLLTLPYSETHVCASNLLPLTAPAWVDQGGRFYLDKERIEGGRSEIRGEPAEKPEKAENP